MAKIVPQGYADINQYTETDSYFKLLEYLDRFGQTYQNVKQQQSTDISNGFQNLVKLLPEVSSQETLDSLKNQYTNLSTRATKTNDETLKLTSQAVGDIINTTQTGFEDFKNVFSNVVS